jgi:dihydrofolate reductase (trimethoprim resistance protein)
MSKADFEAWWNGQPRDTAATDGADASYKYTALSAWQASRAAMDAENEALRKAGKFSLGDQVHKSSGAAWSGKVVGTYTTALTPEGYCVESDAHPGSVQIYPVAALAARPEGEKT